MPPVTYKYVDTSGNLQTTTDQANAPGKDPKSGFQTITSSTLAPSSTQNYTTPTYTQQPDPTTLAPSTPPQIEATAQENQISDFNKRIMALNDSLAGRSTAQASAEQAAGVDSITQAINDNNTALKQLQNDSKAAKLQTENRLAPTFAIAGEQGAIDRATAVKALTLSSISDVLSNNLVAAQHKADRAVEAQFGPLEAELKAKQANVQILLNDPATTIADKNRALKLQFQLDQQKSALDQQKQDKVDVQKVAFDAAQNGQSFIATPQYPTLSTALNAIATAKTPVQALQIQQAAGLVAKAKLDTSVVEVNGQKMLIDNQTGQTIKNLGSSATYSQLHPKASTGSTSPMSILDVQRYQELYPDAGVQAGDTEAIANAKVTASNSPESRTRSLVVAAQANNASYDDVVAEINKDSTIKDKAGALAIAKEVYAVDEQPTSAIEQEITRMKASGILNNSDIRLSLLKKYPRKEVDNSSVSTFLDQIGSFLFGN